MHTPPSTQAWHDAGVTADEMWAGYQTLDRWLTDRALRVQVTRDCHESAKALNTIEWAIQRAERDRQATVLATFLAHEPDPQDPSGETLGAAAANPDAFAALVEWAINDLACAPTGAPTGAELRDWAEQYGHTACMPLLDAYWPVREAAPQRARGTWDDQIPF